MTSTIAAHSLDEPEVPSSPFRAAIGRARIEALAGPGVGLEAHRTEAAAERPELEYRLVRRRGKRSAQEAAWNELGRQGWELVGVTGKHAAFKRRVAGGVSR
jgi:hypothetical protein